MIAFDKISEMIWQERSTAVCCLTALKAASRPCHPATAAMCEELVMEKRGGDKQLDCVAGRLHNGLDGPAPAGAFSRGDASVTAAQQPEATQLWLLCRLRRWHSAGCDTAATAGGKTTAKAVSSC